MKQNNCQNQYKSHLLNLMTITLFSLTTALPLIVNAKKSCHDHFSDQINNHFSDQKNVLRFGSTKTASEITNSSIKVLVWNIHKATDKNLAPDFARISQTADIALIQESVNNSLFTHNISAANLSLRWSMAKSFLQSNGTYTGVATASKYSATQELALLSPVTEPILGTPKTLLVTKYKVRNPQNNTTQELMTVNIHAINFVLNSTFQKHIDQLVSAIRQHRGPLIVAGDFNTWNSGRLNYLNQVLATLGMKHIETPQNGFLILDHVFYRGLKPHAVKDLTHIDSSDHTPLFVEFKIN